MDTEKGIQSLLRRLAYGRHDCIACHELSSLADIPSLTVTFVLINQTSGINNKGELKNSIDLFN